MLSSFKEIWICDFEFRQPDGELPDVRCMVARELHSGRLIRAWRHNLEATHIPPFPVDDSALFVAYFASAELNCFRVMEWPMPKNILDLYVEFRREFCGRSPPAGFGLLGALFAYDLPEVVEKKEMRALAMRRGSEYTDQEIAALLDYCEQDVIATGFLLNSMAPKIDWPRALLRGRYMAGVSAMESNGVPIDTDTFYRLCENWENIRTEIVRSIDKEYGVYEGTTFKSSKFEQLLEDRGISWPRLSSGALDLKSNTFREMARVYPEIAALRELRHCLSELRLNRLAVGEDGRNRCLLSPFGAKTARNLPSNSKFIFGPSTWLRSLIKPGPGQALAYIDYSQQEFAIAAVLSGDDKMIRAYESGDPYLEFAKQAGAVPADGTRQTHSAERKLYKACALAVQYGMGAHSLAGRIGSDPVKANSLIDAHKRTYRQYWKWSDSVVNHALLYGELVSTFGWRVSVGEDPNIRALANWPIQTNGSEILRLAVIFSTEDCIKVCCPVHDALLIEAPADQIDNISARTQKLMQKAGEVVLDGFEIRTDTKIVRHPSRWIDDRGKVMWNKVMQLLENIKIRESDV